MILVCIIHYIVFKSFMTLKLNNIFTSIQYIACIGYKINFISYSFGHLKCVSDYIRSQIQTSPVTRCLQNTNFLNNNRHLHFIFHISSRKLQLKLKHIMLLCLCL